MDVNNLCCACHGTGILKDYLDSEAYEYLECEECQGTGEWTNDA